LLYFKQIEKEQYYTYPINFKIKRTLAGGAPATAVSGITAPSEISIAPAELVVLIFVPLLTKPFG
jgi:hypothetical protein